jgi:5'-3' exonuclease
MPPSANTNDQVDLIVDGNSLFARAWYASQSNPLQDSDGNPIAGIDAGVKIVLSLLDQHSGKIGRVDRTLFCWDTAPKREKPRADKTPEYDEELARFTSALQFLFGSANAIPPAHEADDGVCTAVYRALEQPVQMYVVSGDKDLQQLQGGNVHYYCLNEKTVLSRTFILHRWKVKRPVQIAIALAILGDPGDAVPGIRGWGPKKVERLFSEVTEDMDFNEALAVVDRQIPNELKPVFYESLDLTLLDPAVPDIPEPAPLVWGNSQFLVDNYDLPGLQSYFERVRRQYVHEAPALQDYSED